MGYMKHHAIIVTSWDREAIKQAHTKARELLLAINHYPKFRNISEIVDGAINGQCSFFIAPDGSKEGWQTSDQGDKMRADFIEYLESTRYEDGSIALKYVEISFGEDDYRPSAITKDGTIEPKDS
jgi:hypothetical protein